MNGETSQLDSLNENTDVATITIGGNDALFRDFAFRCVAPAGSCDSSSQEYIDSMDAIENELPDKLDNLYAEIESHAPNAAVYVVGYPQVVPDSSYISCGGFTFTNSEQDAAREVGNALNDEIEAAVGRIGGNFIFVDPRDEGSPFLGNELCTETPFFFGINILETDFSFHPNADGQEAYAELIDGNL